MDHEPGNWVTQDQVQGEPDLIGIPAVEDGDLLALSFHGARKMVRPEAAAFHLGATENLTVIACHSLRDLPPALQRMADIVLPLGAPGPALFRELFGRVFDCEWPPGCPKDAMWLRYVEPHDLERPLRDRADMAEQWRPEDAVDAIRERVERRLTSIDAAHAPALDDLHGMDTAKAVINDVIEDFRGAVAGELDWDQVDRGLLLVGEPGTGKTLLARAAARAAGVHFISTSAARWAVDASEFYDVIRAIRDVFDEAERYAPSILFIDELDSLGRRDQMVDRNRQLEIEELNTVLQELQGFRDRQGVFVIAATNHLDRIDPALTRAGRLDQVVRVSRPTKAALTAILAYHLAPFVEQGRVAEGLDLDQLAAIAVGCTGADIEAFVRDAARRARKDGSAIDAEHLAAAITRAPRSGQGARPLSLAEQERVAYHEAGHALAGLLARDFPSELTIVSIIPRSDGSLGFAGFHGERHPGLTRAGHQQYLEILLAGRAAEEIRYGPRGVSSGAGGESSTSDLALATRHAIRLITELGLHGDTSLRWREADDRRADIALIDDLLDRAYEQVRARLQTHLPLLEAIAERLIAESEVLPDALVSLAEEHGSPLPIRNSEAPAQ
jgi:ATP-dependent Zn protease